MVSTLGRCLTLDVVLGVGFGFGTLLTLGMLLGVVLTLGALLTFGVMCAVGGLPPRSRAGLTRTRLLLSAHPPLLAMLLL